MTGALEEELPDNTEEKLPVENPEAVVEAVLFSVGNSVSYKSLAEVLNYSYDDTVDLVKKLKNRYDSNKKRGITIMELEDSVQMCSKVSMYEHLIKITKIPKKYELSDSALEVLSIVAYKQPVTRIEIEKIRGVSSDYAVNKLIEYGLIQELGRLNAPGKPLLFGTTEEFLRRFGVTSIDDLPTAAPERVEEFKKEAEEEMSVKLDV
ncbi:MAG: SMC-Scp complex subunit ScpB [Lachnospiraceae bacterium]|nr:SMC-Scp complex subunit ScpB [Lachnospiraceae bacterium]